MTDGKEIWLKAGHAEYAREGESALKIDNLANLVGKSRSSFYHLFGDLEEFHDALLEYDLDMTRRFTEESKDVDRFFPDYAEIMIRYKDMLFFNKHVFLNRNTNKKYGAAWDKIAALTDNKTEVLWMRMVNLEDLPPKQREQFYLTIRTAAFMRLQYDTYTYENIYKTVSEVNRSFGIIMDD